MRTKINFEKWQSTIGIFLVVAFAGTSVVANVSGTTLTRTASSGYGGSETIDETITETNPKVVITDSTEVANITIEPGVTDASIDVSSRITGGTGVLPKINIDAEKVDVAIPDSTRITSEDTTWNGIIQAPTITNVNLPKKAGRKRGLKTGIEIGFGGAMLSFDKGVRLVFPGQAGTRVGYTRPGSSFKQINSVCSADSQAAGDSLSANGECKIDSGNDLVVWTKHFTKFATFSQKRVSTGNGNGGNNTGGNGGGTTTTTSTPSFSRSTSTGSGQVALGNTGNQVAAVTNTNQNGDVLANQFQQGENTVSGELSANGDVNGTQPAVTDGSSENTNANINLQTGGTDTASNENTSVFTKIWHWVTSLFNW